MAKFGFILSDSKVFVKDLIQFDFSRSKFSPDEPAAIISHEFSIDNINWINVSEKKTIDWAFNTVGAKTIYLRLTSNIGFNVFNSDIEVMDLVSAKLFTDDNDLVGYEPDIMKYLPKKWSSWNIIHLRAQDYIMNLLSEKAILDKDGNPYTKDDIENKTEVRDWAAALVLRYIFSSTSNADKDVFKAKADQYDEVENDRASRARISLDYNKNSTDDDPSEDLRSIELRRA